MKTNQCNAWRGLMSIPSAELRWDHEAKRMVPQEPSLSPSILLPRQDHIKYPQEFPKCRPPKFILELGTILWLYSTSSLNLDEATHSGEDIVSAGAYICREYAPEVPRIWDWNCS